MGHNQRLMVPGRGDLTSTADSVDDGVDDGAASPVSAKARSRVD
jgi:hypothetical protein